MGSWAEGPVPAIRIVEIVVTIPDAARSLGLGPEASLAKHWVHVRVGVAPTEWRRGLWSLGQGSGSRASEDVSEES